MSFTRFEFKRNWNNASDFATIETDEAKVRADMQALHDEDKDGLNKLMAELEHPNGASAVGIKDPTGADSTVQAALLLLAEQLKNHVDIDPDNLTAENIGLLRELADKYGLTDKLAPTVHDALEVLGALLELEKYQEYWWARRRVLTLEEDTVLMDPVEVEETSAAISAFAFARSSYDKNSNPSYPDVVFEYADEIGVTEAGVYLLEPQTITCRPGAFLDTVSSEMLWGRYVRGVYGENKGVIFRVCEGAELLQDGDGINGAGSQIAEPYCFSASKMQEVYFELPDRPWERIRDPDRNAYPDEGEQDGMEYRYLGVPVERLIDMMVEEATE